MEQVHYIRIVIKNCLETNNFLLRKEEEFCPDEISERELSISKRNKRHYTLVEDMLDEIQMK